MLIPTQTYCLTQFAGLVFPDLLLMSLSAWFTSHFCFLFLNYMKMALPFVIQSSLQSCAWLFPVLISVTCYPNHFPFIQLLLLLTVKPAVATDLTVEPPTNPDFIKCLPCSLRQWPWQLPTAPLIPVDTTQVTRQLLAASHPLAGYPVYIQNAPRTPTLYKDLRSQRSTRSLSPVS